MVSLRLLLLVGVGAVVVVFLGMFLQGEEMAGVVTSETARVRISVEHDVTDPTEAADPIDTVGFQEDSEKLKNLSSDAAAPSSTAEQSKPALTAHFGKIGGDLLGMETEEFLGRAEKSGQLDLVIEILRSYKVGRTNGFIKTNEMAYKNLTQLEKAGAIYDMTMTEYLTARNSKDALVIQLQGVPGARARGVGPVRVAIMRGSDLPEARALLEEMDLLELDTRRRILDIIR